MKVQRTHVLFCRISKSRDLINRRKTAVNNIVSDIEDLPESRFYMLLQLGNYGRY
jgi:hypothetical protein